MSAVSGKQDTASLLFPPVVHVIWGCLLLGAWLISTMMQVETTQAWYMSMNGSHWTLDFNLFLQFPKFWLGELDALQTAAFFVGWGSQVVLISLKVGQARVRAVTMAKFGKVHVTEEMEKNARFRNSAWTFCSLLILGFNIYTDLQYVPSLSLDKQLIFALVAGVVSFFSGTQGVQNIVTGWSHMREN